MYEYVKKRREKFMLGREWLFHFGGPSIMELKHVLLWDVAMAQSITRIAIQNKALNFTARSPAYNAPEPSKLRHV